MSFRSILTSSLGPLRGCALLSAAILAPSVRGQDPSPWLELHGETRPGAVALAWTPDQWREGVTGIIIKKRAIPSAGAPAGPWIPAHPGVIRPGMSPQKDLSAVEPNAAQRQRLQARFRELLSAGKVTPVTADQFLRVMAKPSDGVLGGLRRELAFDHDRALFIGLGMMDRSERLADEVEYGAFPVTGDSAAEQPAATHRSILFAPDDSRLTVDAASATETPDGVQLSWNLPEEEKVRAWSIYAFRVYRRPPDGGAFELLTKEAIGSSDIAEGKRRWSYLDLVTDQASPRTYRIVPVNFFQHELPAGTPLDWRPREAWLEQAGLDLESATLNENGQVRLEWRIQLPPTGSATEFAIERAMLPDNRMVECARVPLTVRNYEDPDAKESNTAYAYRVTLVRGGEALLNSRVQVIVYTRSPPPPSPAGLSARLITIGDGSYIHLKWTPKAADDELTRGFRLYLDRANAGELALQASVPEIAGADSEILVPIDSVMSRRYSVGLTAVADGGAQSKLASTTCFVPGRLIPPVTNLTALRSAEGITLRWEYALPEAIYGYRIAVNGRQVAVETELDPDVHQWTMKTADARSAYRFEVRAVGPNGRSSPAASSSLGAPEAPLGQVDAPQDFQARWTDSGASIELQWTPPAAPVAGYLLTSDVERFGIHGERVRLDSVPRDRILIPVEDSDRSYQFRLWAAGSQSGLRESVYAEALCLAPGRTLPPAFLDPIRPRRQADGRTSLELSWSYPDAPNLVGFRIYANEKRISDESRLGATYRAFTVAPAEIKGVTQFQLEAVGTNKELSERGPSRVWRFGG